MHITIVSATVLEILPYLEKYKFDISETYRYSSNHHTIDIIITGVGIHAATYTLTRYLLKNQPDMMIQVGIGGSTANQKIGELCQIKSETWIDFGAEDADGSIIKAYDLGFINKSDTTYEKDIIINPHHPLPSLTSLNGGTVQQVLGSDMRIKNLLYNSDIQVISMEGAAFFYVSKKEYKGVFHQVRCISNKVTARDKSSWNIDLAIKNLNDFLITFHDSLLA